MSDDQQQIFDDRVAGAFARNGLNTILLDIKEDTGNLLGQVAAIAARMEVIEPVLWQLETDRQRKIGEKIFIAKVSGFITKGRLALVAIFSGGGIAAWLHWPWWK